MPRGGRSKRYGGRVKPKRVILIGTEGHSERAFVAFLQRCCSDAGVNVHLRPWVGSGGDSLAVVEGMVRFVRGSAMTQDVEKKLILLDSDRVAEDRRNGRDGCKAASRAEIEVVLQRPNFEGLLIRLHRGHEQRRVPAGRTGRELSKLWQDYAKPPNANGLQTRFSVDDLRRAARHDPDLYRLLTTVGLLPQHQP